MEKWKDLRTRFGIFLLLHLLIGGLNQRCQLLQAVNDLHLRGQDLLFSLQDLSLLQLHLLLQGHDLVHLVIQRFGKALHVANCILMTPGTSERQLAYIYIEVASLT